MKYVIGIDPDSEAHGVAIYDESILIRLEMLTLVKLMSLVDELGPNNVLFSIENVMANQFIYARNVRASKTVQSKIAMSIGRCQQSYVELTRMLDSLSVRYVTHKPQKGNWAKNKSAFELITGWSKQSNIDTRAAAFFGYLALNRN